MKKEGDETDLGAREISPSSTVVVIRSLGGSVLWLMVYILGMKATVCAPPHSSERFARGRGEPSCEERVVPNDQRLSRRCWTRLTVLKSAGGTPILSVTVGSTPELADVPGGSVEALGVVTVAVVEISEAPAPVWVMPLAARGCSRRADGRT